MLLIDSALCSKSVYLSRCRATVNSLFFSSTDEIVICSNFNTGQIAIVYQRVVSGLPWDVSSSIIKRYIAP